MRILLHSRAFYPALGGLEATAFILASTLSKMGHEVTVATGTAADADVDRRLPFRVVRGGGRTALRALARRADVIHANGFSITTLAFSAASGRPIVFTHQGYQAACLTGLGWHDELGHCGYDLTRCATLSAKQHGGGYAARQLGRHFVGRGVLRMAASNVCVSQFVANVLKVPASAVVMNCVDSELMRAGPAEGPRERFLFVGRLVAEKGVPVLLRAVAAAGVDAALDIVGSGALERDYRRLARELGIEARVRFVGPLRGEPLAQAYRNALAVVVPSVWDEAFGIVAAEALSCGRVALVSDRGGLPEVVDGLGTTFRAGDVDSLARAIRRTIDDPAWREAVEGRLGAVAPRFTADRMAREYVAVYEAAAAR
jgi:glycosyltransferase involved in cell wall biosynthesis